MLWNSGSQTMEEDHLWSVSPTPWATLHSGLRLPFHAKDAAQRAVVYNEISAVIEALEPVQHLLHRVNAPLGSLLQVVFAECWRGLHARSCDSLACQQHDLLEFSQRVTVMR